MKNFKHSLIAVIAVAMISSLAVAQASGLNNSKTERLFRTVLCRNRLRRNYRHEEMRWNPQRTMRRK